MKSMLSIYYQQAKKKPEEMLDKHLQKLRCLGEIYKNKAIGTEEHAAEGIKDAFVSWILS